MINDMARVTVTKTIGHFARCDAATTTYFDDSIYGRYGAPRFASIMRKHYKDDSIVCLSVDYEIVHYTVDVGDLKNIALKVF